MCFLQPHIHFFIYEPIYVGIMCIFTYVYIYIYIYIYVCISHNVPFFIYFFLIVAQFELFMFVHDFHLFIFLKCMLPYAINTLQLLK